MPTEMNLTCVTNKKLHDINVSTWNTGLFFQHMMPSLGKLGNFSSYVT